jgi:transcriptional regulator with XRE-family HTH domain
MADNSWKNLELWDRVKWARSRRFASAIAAAKALGMEPGTYRCYERGPDSAKFIPLDYRHAQAFAREFKVRWEWLLDGLGRPWLTEGDAEPDTEDQSEGKPPNNLQAWRVYRGFTVAELAKKSGLGGQTVNALESGAMELSQKLLNKLADALSTTAGRLLDNNPEDTDPTIFDAVTAIPKERRAQALEILKTFRPYQRLR